MPSRSMWTGTIAFGLVTVPVKLYTATADHAVKFNQLNAATGNRIRQKRVDEKTGDEVDYDKIVKGFPVGESQWVHVTAQELEALAPEKTKQIALERFVDPGEIDVLAFDASYFVGPGTGGAKAYALLVQAMARTDQVGIGRIVMRTRERLVALRVRDDVLVASTLCFAGEINSHDGIARSDGPPPEPSEAEVQMALQLVSALSGQFRHADYADVYRGQVLGLIEAKQAGAPVATSEQPAPAPAPDLLAALEASLALNAPAKPKPKRKPAKRAAKAVTS